MTKLSSPIHRTNKVVLPSPFQLTKVTGLLQEQNVDTVSLHDILGDPLIKQAWIFNFCFDVNWTMQHFDPDVRQLVDVKIVHGSWRKEDGNRLAIKEHLQNWKNVQEIQAYMPDAFGTHHSKMIILFKYDDTAQVIIHTANMLEKDWEHMTQAVWRSPLLPLQRTPEDKEKLRSSLVGSGARFKHDLSRYIRAYGSKLKTLVEQLSKYDFSQVRGALIASVPSYQKSCDSLEEAWGHLALRNALAAVNSKKSTGSAENPHLVSQVSSIATLPASWLDETIYKAANLSTASSRMLERSPLSTSIVYPTPSDLRNALTGYATGGSIHTKVQSAAQQKQVSLLRPQLHRWQGHQSNIATHAGRHLVPPHIKTYICFSAKPTSTSPAPDINWALVTSANLSTQAWGTVARLPKGVKDLGQAVVHIQSFEIGVLVWPELFSDTGVDCESSKTRMVPMFGKDMPEASQTLSTDSEETVIGMRMPYDLPLTPYDPDEMPWSPSATYTEPDRLGRTWD
ncbi:hypothetical protein LTS08_001576 [Lithohypha guttulata]|uniref:uncharacterized protein n=1 Tax=Lithohypha guttulata TaxID=1690604 RepID=UPI002DE13592|nr:hypothetical protein LTR51_003756 [Lithohypha guttulata]KAK5105299.1 hypothetical protein LTS08_001576 [Lithohypha guttulata]